MAEGACVHSGVTPDAAWTSMLGHLNSSCVKAGLSPPACKFISGEEFFGFTHPTVSNLLLALPNADRCRFFARVRSPVLQTVPEVPLQPFKSFH